VSATLVSLRIRNLALVEDMLWEPQPGFTAVTGETGAGKSVILGAVKLLLGERADKSAIRSGADQCAVEGVFEVAADSPVHGILENAGAEPCEDGALLVKRTLPANGAGRQFVNGSPCTLALLQELGDLLVDLHGPHDHQSLFSKDRQLAMLDTFAGATPLREAHAAKRSEWQRLAAERDRLTANSEALARETELLEHQTKEIAEASLRDGEEEELVDRQRAAANSQRLCELCANLSALLGDSDDSIQSRLSDAVRMARELQRLDPRAEPISSSIVSLFDSVRDLPGDLDHYAASLDADPRSLAAIDARLDTIQSLKRKYGSSISEILRFAEQAASRLALLRSAADQEGGLGAQVKAARTELESAAKKLSTSRRKALPKLEDLVRRELADLGFARCGFSIQLTDCPPESPSGAESAEFLFSPNPGEPERALRAIASSGEISRVMLALKTALAKQGGVPVLVFDEIDANVGGEIGSKVGRKMRALSRHHQVFCITHLPQVAAAADCQFLVRKESRANRTTTSLEEAKGAAREAEIARMLGGGGGSALEHARNLLSAK
jgi:DNA repair protein RecN (Recombination protein N)